MFKWLREEYHVPPDMRATFDSEEFEEWVREKHGLILSEVQRAWARSVLAGVDSTYFLAFTGFGKTTIIRLLSEYLADKGHRILIVTQAGPAKQLHEKIRKDWADGKFSKIDNVEVVSYQSLSSVLTAAFKSKKKDPILSQEFDYVFLDDVEGILDDMRTISLWKAFVLKVAFPQLKKPIIVTLDKAKELFGEKGWGSAVQRWLKELYSTMLIELEPDEIAKVRIEELEEAVRRVVVHETFEVLDEYDFPPTAKKIIKSYPIDIIGVGPSLEELFNAAGEMDKDEFKEKVKETVKGVLRLSEEIDRAWRVLYGIEDGFKTIALLILKRFENSQWQWNASMKTRVVVSSASFSSSSRLWGFLTGLRGAVGGRKIAYFGTQVKPELVEIVLRKERADDVELAVEKVLDVWKEIDFKSNVLVFIDTGLFDEKELKRIVELGNEKLREMGLPHAFVRVSSSITSKKGFYERKNYKACNVEWLVEHTRVAGGDGPYYAIVGSAAPNSPIVRGLDLPGKAPVAVFIGTPSIATRVEVPKDERELAAYLVRSILNFVNVEKIVRAYAEEAARLVKPAEVNSATRAAKTLLKKVLRAKEERLEIAREVAKGERDFEELIPFGEIAEEVEAIWRLVEKVRELGVEKIEKYAPNVTVFVQALGRTARALGVKDGKVLYHKGLAVIYEWRRELIDFLERSVLRNARAK